MVQDLPWRTASEATRLTPGHYSAELAAGWDILGATNGGYVLAVLARAMADAADRESPASITCHYLKPIGASPVRMATDEVKQGRRLATMRGSMSKDGKLLAEALGAFGAYQPAAPMQLSNGSPPDIPPLEECVRIRSAAATWDGPPDEVPPVPPPFMDRVDLPPTTFNAGLPIAWTPTVELTVHVRAKPAPGPLRLDYRSRFVAQDRLEVDGLIWDSDDSLIVQSRQLALVPMEG